MKPINSSEFHYYLQGYLSCLNKPYFKEYQGTSYNLFEMDKSDARDFFELNLFPKFETEQENQLKQIKENAEKIKYLEKEYADFKDWKDSIGRFYCWNLCKSEMIYFIERCMIFLEKRITEIDNNTGTEKPQPILKSFDGSMSDEQLRKLHTELIVKKYIAKSDFNDFKPIFRAEAIETIKQVKWIKACSKNKKELSKISLIDFIRVLAEKKFIDEKFNEKENYKNLFAYIETLFIDGLNNKQLKYTQSNYTESRYEFYKDLEQIISSL